ncbi:apolipo protein O-domain-containing protein [Sphaerosporella brunnea]|uniref:MICOS complex subunit n=1 Tax=Sphaerosporella brunnea TaxID=1250544 RepID=A0A5J5F1E5_9PEZI|nr:apolipo protein O-domain-containing protein [Sphaerosporella brunnea]
MASQLPRLRRTALPLAGLAATTLLASSTVFAEEARHPTKKPIYDAPPPPQTPLESMPTYPTPTERLAQHIGKARRFINVHYRLACDKLDDAFSHYLSYEHSVTRTIAALAPPKNSPEKVLPGAIYVAVATMAGGIIARKRIWPIRILTPIAVGIGSAWYFIPQTTQNVGELLWEWEKKVPQVAETHQQIRQSIEEAVRKTYETTIETRKKVDEAVHNVRKSAEDLVKRG